MNHKLWTKKKICTSNRIRALITLNLNIYSIVCLNDTLATTRCTFVVEHLENFVKAQWSMKSVKFVINKYTNLFDVNWWILFSNKIKIATSVSVNNFFCDCVCVSLCVF